MLDNKQLAYLKDQDFLKSKQVISEKITSELSGVEERLKEIIRGSDFDYPNGTFTKSGKISKGENYKGLPFFILDYPRLFLHEDMFNYRVMIWWGNEISCSLLLLGRSYEKYRKTLSNNKTALNDFFFCVNESPWEYHFERSNFVPISEMDDSSFQNSLNQRAFIKFAIKYPLEKLDELKSLSCETYKKFLTLLSGDNIRKDR